MNVTGIKGCVTNVLLCQELRGGCRYYLCPRRCCVRAGARGATLTLPDNCSSATTMCVTYVLVDVCSTTSGVAVRCVRDVSLVLVRSKADSEAAATAGLMEPGTLEVLFVHEYYSLLRSLILGGLSDVQYARGASQGFLIRRL